MGKSSLVLVVHVHTKTHSHRNMKHDATKQNTEGRTRNDVSEMKVMFCLCKKTAISTSLYLYFNKITREKKIILEQLAVQWKHIEKRKAFVHHQMRDEFFDY